MLILLGFVLGINRTKKKKKQLNLFFFFWLYYFYFIFKFVLAADNFSQFACPDARNAYPPAVHQARGNEDRPHPPLSVQDAGNAVSPQLPAPLPGHTATGILFEASNGHEQQQKQFRHHSTNLCPDQHHKKNTPGLLPQKTHVEGAYSSAMARLYANTNCNDTKFTLARSLKTKTYAQILIAPPFTPFHLSTSSHSAGPLDGQAVIPQVISNSNEQSSPHGTAALPPPPSRLSDTQEITPTADTKQWQLQPSPSVSPLFVKEEEAKPHLCCKLSLCPPEGAAMTFFGHGTGKENGWVSGVMCAGGVVGGGESGSWDVATGVWERQVHLEEVTRMNGYFFSSENYSIMR